MRPTTGRRRPIHHSPIFWVGIALCLAAIAIYLWSDDQSWPHRLHDKPNLRSAYGSSSRIETLKASQSSCIRARMYTPIEFGRLGALFLDFAFFHRFDLVNQLC
jgi:hypothetical protein